MHSTSITWAPADGLAAVPSSLPLLTGHAQHQHYLSSSWLSCTTPALPELQLMAWQPGGEQLFPPHHLPLIVRSPQHQSPNILQRLRHNAGRFFSMSSVESGPDQLFDVAFLKWGFSRGAILSKVKWSVTKTLVVFYLMQRLTSESIPLLYELQYCVSWSRIQDPQHTQKKVQQKPSRDGRGSL